jgi:hypothetical protein
MRWLPRRTSTTAADAYHRLRLLEGITGLVLGLPLVAVSLLGNDLATPLLWVSLAAIPPMLALIAVALHTWRRLLTSELRSLTSGGLHPHTAPRRAQPRTRNIALATTAALVLLTPVPQTWGTFWFVAGLLSLAWAITSLTQTWFSTRRRPHRGPTNGTSSERPRG